jgi:hypothetical protein
MVYYLPQSSACAYPDASDVADDHSTSDRAPIEVTPMADSNYPAGVSKAEILLSALCLLSFNFAIVTYLSHVPPLSLLKHWLRVHYKEDG